MVENPMLKQTYKFQNCFNNIIETILKIYTIISIILLKPFSKFKNGSNNIFGTYFKSLLQCLTLQYYGDNYIRKKNIKSRSYNCVFVNCMFLTLLYCIN